MTESSRGQQTRTGANAIAPLPTTVRRVVVFGTVLWVVVLGAGFVTLFYADSVAEKKPALAVAETIGEVFPATVPKPIADLRFVDGTGQPRSLADFRGKAVLLNLWATWCVPCRKEMPALDRLQANVGGSGFEVVAL